MTENPNADFLASLGLSTDMPAKAERKEVQVKIPLDARTMPVSDIVFDPRLLDGFVLDGTDMKQASDKVFALYKSVGKNRERNGLLHRRITEFINQVKRSRGEKPVGHVKQVVKAQREQRDLAALLAENGITADEMVAFIEALNASKA